MNTPDISLQSVRFISLHRVTICFKNIRYIGAIKADKPKKIVPKKRTGGKIRRSDFRTSKRTASEFAGLSNNTQKDGSVVLQAIKVNIRSFSAAWQRVYKICEGAVVRR